MATPTPLTIRWQVLVLPVLVGLLAACSEPPVDDVTEPTDEAGSGDLQEAELPELVELATFEATFDPETEEFTFEMQTSDEFTLAEDADGSLRVVRQSLFCPIRVTRGVSETFSMSVDLFSIHFTPAGCGLPDEFPYTVLGAFCADVTVRSYLSREAFDVYAEVVGINPDSGYNGYQYPFGTGANPDEVPVGPGMPTDINGGLWSYGDLGPAGSPTDRASQTWTFQFAGGFFRFHGRLVGRFLELVNNQDDDCDGRIDEGTGSYTRGTACVDHIDCATEYCSPANVCDVCEGLIEPDETCSSFEPTPENSDRVEVNSLGEIELSVVTENESYVWIANYQDGTVSHFDSVTGRTIGRYPSRANAPGSCATPSRTAVDNDGNVWVGNRSRNRNCGGVTKIARYTDVCERDLRQCACVDRNHNGVIDTSHDLDGDGDITGHEYLGANDECVLFSALPTVFVRALAVDHNNVAWIGDWHNRGFHKIDASTGAYLNFVPMGIRPYNATVDTNGILWSPDGCCGGGRIRSVDTNTDQVGPIRRQPWGDRGNYGIDVDSQNRVWMGGYPRVNWTASRYDPGPWPYNMVDTGNWVRTASTCRTSSGKGRGVTVDSNDVVWVGQHGGRSNSRCDDAWYRGRITGYADDPSGRPTVVVRDQYIGDLCVVPTGVDADEDDDIWLSCQRSMTATEVDSASDGYSAYRTQAKNYIHSNFSTLFEVTRVSEHGDYYFTGQSCANGSAPTAWDLLSWNGTIADDDTAIRVYFRTAPTEETLAAAPWQGPYEQDYLSNDSPVDVSALAADAFYEVRVSLISTHDEHTPRVSGIRLSAVCPASLGG